MAVTLGKWGDGGHWGDELSVDPNNKWNDAVAATKRKEALVDLGLIHRLSVRFNYTAASESAPIIANISALAKAQFGQNLYSHEALFDQQIGTISVKISHTSPTDTADFVISNIQLLVQGEKQRPRG